MDGGFPLGSSNSVYSSERMRPNVLAWSDGHHNIRVSESGNYGRYQEAGWSKCFRRANEVPNTWISKWLVELGVIISTDGPVTIFWLSNPSVTSPFISHSTVASCSSAWIECSRHTMGVCVICMYYPRLRPHVSHQRICLNVFQQGNF